MENENKENKNEEELRKEDKNKEDLKKEEENKEEKNKEKLMITLDFIKKEHDSAINRERILENKAIILWGALGFFLTNFYIREASFSLFVISISKNIIIDISFLLRILTVSIFFLITYFLYKVLKPGPVNMLYSKGFNIKEIYSYKRNKIIEQVIEQYLAFKNDRDERCNLKAKELGKATKVSYIFLAIIALQIILI